MLTTEKLKVMFQNIQTLMNELNQELCDKTVSYYEDENVVNPSKMLIVKDSLRVTFNHTNSESRPIFVVDLGGSSVLTRSRINGVPMKKIRLTFDSTIAETTKRMSSLFAQSMTDIAETAKKNS